MNSKITFPELVDMVAKKAGTSKRVAELFLKELFATVTQAITTGDSVIIKGIGSFKVIQVSARRSVNVNTGEEIEIPGHRKLTFVADKTMAEAVNQPFAQFDTVVLNDDVTDEQLEAVDHEPIAPSETSGEGEASHEEAAEPDSEKQAEADVEEAMATVVKNTAAPADGTVDDGSETTEEQEETPPVFVAPVTPVKPATEEPVPSSEAQSANQLPVQQTDQTDMEQPSATDDENSQPNVQPDDDVQLTDEQNQEAEQAVETADDAVGDEPPASGDEGLVEDEKQKRRIMHRSLLEGFLVGVVTTIVVSLVSYRLYLMKCPGSEQTAVEATAVTVAKPAQPHAPKAATRLPQGRVEHAATPVDSTKTAPVRAQAQQQVYDTIKPSTTLNRMSSKHYGKGVFWVYIYEENKAVIDDPNMIPMGTRLVIPPASKYGIDKNSPASIEAAKKKQSQIYNRMLNNSRTARNKKAEATGPGGKNKHAAGGKQHDRQGMQGKQ